MNTNITNIKQSAYMDVFTYPASWGKSNIIDLDVDYKLRESGNAFILSTIGKPTGIMLFINKYGLSGQIFQNGSSLTLSEVFNSGIACSPRADEYRNNLASDLMACKGEPIEVYREVIDDYIHGQTFDEYVEDTHKNWVKLFAYNAEHPICYWINRDSFEDDNPDSGESIVKIQNYEELQCLFCTLEDGSITIDYILAHPDQDTMNIKLGDMSEEAQLALFTEISRKCASFNQDGQCGDLLEEIEGLIKTFDFAKFITKLGQSQVHGRGFGNSSNPVEDVVENVRTLEEASTEEVLEFLDEYDDPEIDMIPQEPIRSTKPARKTGVGLETVNGRLQVRRVKEPVKMVEPEETKTDRQAYIQRYEDQVKFKDLRVIPNESNYLSHIGYDDSIVIHNYTGYTLNIVNNAVRDPRTGKFVLNGKPNIIRSIASEGRLTSTETIVDLGYAGGIPVSEVVPSRISQIPNVDGIIVVSSVYYKNAIRMGFDTSRLFIAVNKLEYSNNGKVEYYYTGLTKRL